MRPDGLTETLWNGKERSSGVGRVRSGGGISGSVRDWVHEPRLIEEGNA